MVTALNGQLLPRAMVMARKGSKQGPVTLGRADDNGHFLIDHLEAGTYILSAGKQGYFVDEHKHGLEATVELAAGTQVKDVVVRLLPLGVIAGRIVDEANDPIRGVEVRLLGQERYRGREFLNTSGSAVSDDRGEYRIFDIRPGSYFLLAQHNLNKEWKKVSGALPIPGTRLDVAYPPVLYPETTDMLQAQKIAVHVGDVLTADFAMFPVQAVSIQGGSSTG